MANSKPGPLDSKARTITFFMTGPVRVAFFLALAFLTLGILTDNELTAKHIPSAAFATSLAMASASFAYSKALDGEPATRDEVVRAGECLIGAAHYFLLASIIKYGAVYMPRHGDVSLAVAGSWACKLPDWLISLNNRVVHPFLAGMTFLLFLLGASSFRSGVLSLVKVAGQRFARGT